MLFVTVCKGSFMYSCLAQYMYSDVKSFIQTSSVHLIGTA